MSNLRDLDPSGGFCLFTDGSAYTKDRSGGWAWLALDAFEGEFHVAGGRTETTNNRMEMLAWIKGLNALHKTFGPCEILVYSDSEYVGLGAMDSTRNRKLNKDLWFWLDQTISAHKYVEFVHVKGHSGQVYNERVDKLAGEARRAHNNSAP